MYRSPCCTRRSSGGPSEAGGHLQTKIFRKSPRLVSTTIPRILLLHNQFHEPRKSHKIVGEDVNHGPIWDAFEDLQSFGMTKFAIDFQSSNLTEDLLTMLCARNLAESKSTMMHILRLGFAVQRFTPDAGCPGAFLSKAQQVYFVDPGKFGGGHHTNSAEEWVAMLLHGKAFPPRLCT